MINFHTEIPLEVEVEAICISPGIPESAPSFSCAGEPAEGPEYDVKVFHNGHDITALLDPDVLEDIRSQVIDEGEEDPDVDLDMYE